VQEEDNVWWGKTERNGGELEFKRKARRHRERT
jgi:hypothetical protein